MPTFSQIFTSKIFLSACKGIAGEVEKDLQAVEVHPLIKSISGNILNGFQTALTEYMDKNKMKPREPSRYGEAPVIARADEEETSESEIVVSNEGQTFLDETMREYAEKFPPVEAGGRKTWRQG